MKHGEQERKAAVLASFKAERQVADVKVMVSQSYVIVSSKNTKKAWQLREKIRCLGTTHIAAKRDPWTSCEKSKQKSLIRSLCLFTKYPRRWQSPQQQFSVLSTSTSKVKRARSARFMTCLTSRYPVKTACIQILSLMNKKKGPNFYTINETWVYLKAVNGQRKR